MTAPTETQIKERLASIASTATGITVLSYTPFLEMPGVDVSALGLLQGERLHYGYVSKISRRHVERTVGRKGSTVRIGIYRINFVRGIEVDQAGEGALSANVEDLVNYFEKYHDNSDEIFPTSTYPGVTIQAGEGAGREDAEEIQRTPDNKFINFAWYQLTVHVRVQRGP